MAEGYEGYQGYGAGGYGAMDPATMRSRLAMAMLERGADSSPIRSPWQGAARMSNALFGALMLRQQQDAYGDSWKKALSGMPTGLPGTAGAVAGGMGSPGLPAQPGALADLANDPSIMRGVANAATNGLPDTATIGASLARGASPPQMGPPMPTMAPNNVGGGAAPGGPMPGSAIPAGGPNFEGPNQGAMVGSIAPHLDPRMMVAGPGAPSFTPPASGNSPQGAGAGAFNPEDLAMFQQDMQAVPGSPPGGVTGGRVLDQLKANIAKTESGGNYAAVGPDTGNGNRALGKYQVMASNVPSWTKEVLGQEMTPQQFLANPQAQEAVANGKLGGYLQQYGPAGAARAWFTGSPVGKGADVNGMTGDRYAALATQGMGAPGSTGPLAFGNGAVPPASPALAAIQGAAAPPGGLAVPPASMQPHMMVAGPGAPSNAPANSPRAGDLGSPQALPPPDAGGGGNPLSALGNMFGIGNPSSPQGGNAPAPAGNGAPGEANPHIQQLMQVLADPYAAPGAKQVAMQFLQYYMPHPFEYQPIPGTNDERQLDWMKRPTGVVMHGGPKTDNLAPGATLYQTDSSGLNPHPVAGWGARAAGTGGVGGAPQQEVPAGAAAAIAAGRDPNTPLPGEPYEAYKSRMEAQGKAQGALANPGTEDYAKVTQGARGDESYKEADLSTNAYNGMVRAATLDTHASDKTLIDSFNQIMNPNTRNGVGMFNINSDLQSFPDELRGEIAKAWNGQGKLSPQTRAAMLTDSRIRVEAYRSSWDAARSGWLATAKHGNIDESAVPNLIQPMDPDWSSISRYSLDAAGHLIDNHANNGQGAIVPHETLQSVPGQSAPGPAQPQQGGGGARPPTVTDQAGYDALPKGAPYIGPDGQPRTKR